jgi:hypothetical protein
VLVVLLAAGCKDCRTPPSEPSSGGEAGPPQVAAIEILTDLLQVPTDVEFELRARVWDNEHHIMPVSAGTLTWTTYDPALHLQSSSGESAIFLLTSPTALMYKVHVELGSTSIGDDAVIEVATPTTTTDDEVLGPIVTGGPTTVQQPMFAIYSGTRSGADFRHALVAFVTRGRVANVEAAGDLALLSPDYAAAILKVPWLPEPAEVANFRGLGSGIILHTPVAPVSAQVHVMDATTDHAVDLIDLHLASVIFRRNGAGIDFVEDDGVVTRLAPLMVTVGQDCSSFETTFPGAGFDPKSGLWIYYVQDIQSDDVTLGDWLAWTCDPDPVAGRGARIIFIQHNAYHLTLAHELGHASSLMRPNFGHVNCIGGFDMSNLMWAYPDDGHAESRQHLTLGQVFRVTADDSSWVNMAGFRGGEPRYQCREQDKSDPYRLGGECPRLPYPNSRPAELPCGG